MNSGKSSSSGHRDANKTKKREHKGEVKMAILEKTNKQKKKVVWEGKPGMDVMKKKNKLAAQPADRKGTPMKHIVAGTKKDMKKEKLGPKNQMSPAKSPGGLKRKAEETSAQRKKMVRFSDRKDVKRESEEEPVQSDVEDEEDSEDDDVRDEEQEDEAVVVDESSDAVVKAEEDENGKPKVTSKEAHQEQKKTKLERKQKDNKFFELATRAKKIWEEARREDCSDEKRIQLMDQLTKLTKGHVKEIIRAHDTVRVVECIVALGTDKHRTILFEELKDILLELTKSKYGKFFVLKMLKYGNRDQKAKIISSFYGHVTKLLRHKEASAVVENAYNDVANAKQRAMLVQEFYGPEFALFKNEGTFTLDQALEKANEAQKKKILTGLKDMLVKMTEKTIFRHSITHYLLRELFKHADEDMKAELVDALKEVVVELVHTKDGARVAMECLWAAAAKERKTILKSFKKFVVKTIQEDHGYLVVLAAFDSVDDTKLLEKSIITEMVSGEAGLALAKSKNGIKVFEYILSPRDPRYFHKDIVEILEAGDQNSNSKKDRKVRNKELLEAASPHLLRLVTEHANDLVTTNASCLLIMNILNNAVEGPEGTSSKAEAINSLVKVISSEGLFHETKGEANKHPIERDAVSYLLTKMIKGDADKFKSRGAKGGPYFSDLFGAGVSKEVFRSYIGCNRGCFLLLNLLDTKIPLVVKKLNSALEGLNRTLGQKEFKGAKLLLDRLKSN